MSEKKEVLDAVEETGKRFAEVRGRIRGIRKKTRRALIRPIGDGIRERVNSKIDGWEERLNERIAERTETRQSRRPARDVSFRLRSGNEGIASNPSHEQASSCPKCGTAVAGDAEFCPKCGTNVRDPTPYIQKKSKESFYI